MSAAGRPSGFVRALLLRDWVYHGLLALAVSSSSIIIPFAFSVLPLLNYVPLMGEDRRCLHDYLAGTQVRWVRIVEVHLGRLVTAGLGVALVGAGGWAAVKHETVLPLLRSTFEAARAAPSPAVASAPAEASEPMQSHASQPLAVEDTPPASAPVSAPAPPPAPTALPEARPQPTFHQYVDTAGVVHVTDDLSTVPERYRASVTTPLAP